MTTTASKEDQRPARELLVEVTVTTDAVRTKSWQSPEISGSGAPLELIGSTTSPLSTLDSAGLGWVVPLVRFLDEPLDQLRGSPEPVTSGAEGYGSAGKDVTTVADNYRKSAAEETDGWSGAAASGYGEAGSQYADGLAALGESSTTVASALTGAGEVVAQVVEIVTQLVAEAVGTIVPIMSEAVAAAPMTFGQSIAAALPQCVQIAVDAGRQVLGKLAALLSSGQNLLELVDGAVAVMQVVKKVLSAISQQSTQPRTETQPTSRNEIPEEQE